MSTKQTQFLEKMVYGDQQQKSQETILHKPTDQPAYYMHNLIIPNLLKTGFHTVKHSTKKQYVQLPLNPTKNCDIITKRFKERGQPENLVN